MNHQTLARACAMVLVAGPLCQIARADAVEDFYKGRTVELLIASEAGGGYDVYARLAANFLEKHLPGHPRFIAKQMVGAGGIVATNYLANVAARDGSVIAQVQNTVPFQPLLAPQRS